MKAAQAQRKSSLEENQNLGAPGLSLYIHWPFCKAKCPYCDFNSHVRTHIDQLRWRRSLLQDMRCQAERIPARRPLRSIFFGGGTPSLMPPETVEALIGQAGRLFGFEDDIEITLEANPTSVEADRFAAYADAGVNRVSLGVQSLDDQALQFLGREHSAREAMAAIAIAKANFTRVSFDLIYARAGQTSASWQSELSRALELTADHISLYQLTIEEGTRFHAAFRAGRLPVLEDEMQERLFEETVETLNAQGFEWYEISNFALAGSHSRHNLVYWRYGDYAGIGPGAHGRLQDNGKRLGTVSHRAPDKWLNAVSDHGHGLCQTEIVAPGDAVIEALMMGMRLEEGVPFDRLARIAGEDWRHALNWPAIARADAAGLLRTGNERLIATAKGRMLLDSLLAQITD